MSGSGRWFIAIQGKKFGPLTDHKIKRMAENHILSPQDHVWKKGMPDWLQAGQIRGLFPPELMNGKGKGTSNSGITLTDEEWYYNNEGNKLGPVTLAELKKLAEEGIITKETFLWKKGAETGWRPAGQCEEWRHKLMSKGMSRSHPLFKLLTKWKSA